MISCEDLELAQSLLPIEFLNTLYMVASSTFFAFIIGLPLGIILILSDRGGLREKTWVYTSLGALVNMGRSIPFAILIILIFPITRWIVGTSIGTTASIVPLTIAAIPFMARVIESALREVERSVLDAARVMGSTTYQIIRKVWIAEALPSIIPGVTLTVVNLIGYSAMAGLVGGGGLGKVAIQYGYYRFNGFIMVTTTLLLILLVATVQWIGNALVRSIIRKRGKA